MAADADAALLFVGRRLNPPAAGVVMLDMDAVNKDGERLPFAVQDLLARLESPLLPACAPDDHPPLELHIQDRAARLPVRSMTSLK